MSRPKNIFKKHKKMIILMICLLIFMLGAGFSIYYWLLKPMSISYQQGLILFSQGHYEEAQQIFCDLKNYRNSAALSDEISTYLYADQLLETEDYEAAIKFLNSIPHTNHVENRFQSIYNIGLSLKENGDYNTALCIFLRLKNFEDSRQHANELIKLIDSHNQITLATGYRHFVSLTANGTLEATGNNNYGQCNIQNWSNIKKVYAEGNYTVGIKNDNSIIVTGDIAPDGMSITEWKNIKDIILFPYPNLYKAIGLRNDGTVVSTSENSAVHEWKNIQAISASKHHIIGLKTDGTLVSTGLNDVGQCNISTFEHITQVIAGNSYTIGLKDDGTIAFTGELSYKDAIINWENIDYLWSNNYFTIGLQTDGSIVVAGIGLSQNSLSSWKNICQIGMNSSGIVGLQLNHSLISIGLNELSSFDEVDNFHVGEYEFGAIKCNGTLVTKDLLEAPTADDFKKRAEPVLGMTTEAVKASTWGLPSEIICTTDQDGYHQQWIYGNDSILFLNGIVISIQQKVSEID